MVRVKKKFLKVRETSGNLNRGKLMSWRKVRENWNHLIETFEVTLISTTFLLNEIGKFVENVLVLMNDWKDDCNLKPEATTTYDIFSQGNTNIRRKVLLVTRVSRSEAIIRLRAVYEKFNLEPRSHSVLRWNVSWVRDYEKLSVINVSNSRTIGGTLLLIGCHEELVFVAAFRY